MIRVCTATARATYLVAALFSALPQSPHLQAGLEGKDVRLIKDTKMEEALDTHFLQAALSITAKNGCPVGFQRSIQRSTHHH